MKSGDYNEIKALKRFSDLVTIEQFGYKGFVRGKPMPEDFKAAEKGLIRVKEVLSAGSHDMVILEEGNVAVMRGLFPVTTLLEVIDLKPDNVELIITGRGAMPEIIEKADLVTEMKEIKHYFKKGVKARAGIEK